MIRKITLGLLFLIFCACQEQQFGFVSKSGTDLVYNGLPYVINGANQYYLFYKSQKMVDEVIEDAAALGLNTIRTWGFCDGEIKDNGFCFQPSPGVYHEPTFKNMDYVIYKAAQHKIKLVIPFVNNWDNFGGMIQYVKWSPTAKNKTHDAFYTDPWSKEAYKAYVSYFLNRTNSITGKKYKDEPTILMWELTNEMRNNSDPEGKDTQAWVEEMAGFIKKIDSKHLLSTGQEGFGRGSEKDWLHNNYEGTNFIKNNAIKDIDVATFHLYPEHWGIDDAYSRYWIESSIRLAHEQLGKPVYCGEFGVRDKAKRNMLFVDWYQLHRKLQGDGMMFWILSGHQDDGSMYPDYDGFTIQYPEDKSIIEIISSNRSNL